MTFYVSEYVRQEIFGLSSDQETQDVLFRCIGGYSEPTGFMDRIQKTIYRIRQWWNSYPDWNRCCDALATKSNLSMPGSDNGNAPVAVMRAVAMVPIMFLEALSNAGSGTRKLEELISANR